MRRNLYDRSVMAAKTTRRKYKKKAIVGNTDFVFRVIEGLGLTERQFPIYSALWRNADFFCEIRSV